MKLVYLFTAQQEPKLTEVGGKGISLILMTQQGLSVPPGFVLSVAFFKPWFEYIQKTSEWIKVLNSSSEDLKKNCNNLKKLCMDLKLDDEHRKVLAQALKSLKEDGKMFLFAVRSSSPEEDLEGASFAGGYETVLGVKEDELEDALRKSFTSCLNERVFLYKKEHGFAVDKPRIAVIIQKQIAAQTAGVAFSLNPINNCYDEAVINANFGLGESVVLGMISPDSFIVDKVSHTILGKKIGKKETSIWLDSNGGTYKKPASSHALLCLSDEEVLVLTDILINVEAYYKKPIDIEWAFADEKIYLLQARPITAYYPLPEKLVTAPGEQKYVYQVDSLVHWGMEEPLSVMGTDYVKRVIMASYSNLMGRRLGTVAVEKNKIPIEGRTYANISFGLKIQGKKRMVDGMRMLDNTLANIIENIDEKVYVPEKLPPELKGMKLGLILQNIGKIGQIIKALLNPVSYRERYLEEERHMLDDLKREVEKRLSLTDFTESTIARFIAYSNAFWAIMIASEIARSKIKSIFKDQPPQVKDKLMYLERALPDNVTVKMGLAMYHLARFQEIRECKSGEEFATKLKHRFFSSEFLKAWDKYKKEYGCRCPMEMDPVTTRIYEQPIRFFKQLHAMTESTDAEHNPQAIYEKAISERENAYQELLQVAQRKGKRKAKSFKKNYDVLMLLGGYRESPKYYLVLITDMFRQRVLKAAQPLVSEDRLDTVEQVFNLTIDELERGLVDPSIDLKALAEKNIGYLKKFRNIHEVPRVIDSRGKILRAPKKEKEAVEGELAGEPISPGIVRGKVKVLHRPDEKPVLPGEILVARATDPGWTPLFINAGGVILEIGGLLQHGALVAREYGKPCIAGIENATSILKDGQMVEIDGLSGVVRLNIK